MSRSWPAPGPRGRAPRAGRLDLHGGRLLECRFFGAGDGIARLWTVCSLTHAERVVFVLRAELMPANGDDVFWLEGHDVTWSPRDELWAGFVLSSFGACSDPLAEDLLMRDALDG